MANNRGHLGGHANTTHIDLGSLLYIKEKCNISSMLDIGCSIGGMVKLAREHGITCDGVDGDETLSNVFPDVIIHDFYTGPYKSEKVYDLIWSVEFLEHIDEKYIANVFQTFSVSPLICITHAMPGVPGYHHVNCQDSDYWIKKFMEYGYLLCDDLTSEIRKRSTMKRDFIRNTGMVFRSSPLREKL